MTHEEAQRIDQLERYEENWDLIQRALAYSKHKRAEERAKLHALVIVDPKTTFVIPPSTRPPEPKVEAPKGNFGVLYHIADDAHTVAEWARKSGVKAATLYARLRRGITIHEAIRPNRCTRTVRKKEEASVDIKPTRFYGKSTQVADIYTVNGVSKTMSEWAIASGISRSTLRTRVKNRGLTMDEALSLRPYESTQAKCNRGAKPILHTIDGITKTKSEWAAWCGVHRTAIERRVQKGQTFREAVRTLFARFRAHDTATTTEGAGVVRTFEVGALTGEHSTAQDRPELRTFSSTRSEHDHVHHA